MNAQELINIITPSDILTLMNDLGADLVKETNEYFIFTSICHGSESSKLYYYFTKRFYCYSNCGSMSVYDLIMKVKDCDFKNAYDYLRTIVNGYNKPITGFGGRQFKNVNLDDVVLEQLPVIDKPYLYKMYSDCEIKEWVNENITYDITKKFNVRFDKKGNKAIIPVFQNRKCVGIRTRCFDIKDIMKGNKYIPLWYDDTCYNFPTAKVLYGLDETKEAIKKYQRILIYEGEKSVYKTQKYLGNKNCSVAMFGSKLSHTHKKIILDLANGNKNFEIILAMDKEFENYNSDEGRDYEKKIIKNLDGLQNYIHCSYIIDKENLLDMKMSPIDAGENVFKELLRNRVSIN